MSRIYLPSPGPDGWKQFLAEPEKQWKTGFSAKTLAQCWEAANGLPPEIAELFKTSGGTEPELLLAIPEHKVRLPGGQRESQTDVFALIRCDQDTISTAVEGKVRETFGPTLGEWSATMTEGKRTRLAFLCDTLGLPASLPPQLRYQLLHRTASAVIEAQRFKTDAAAMIVHSFSVESLWFDDLVQFAALLGQTVQPGRLMTTRLPSGLPLYLGWATGDQKFLSA